MWKATEPSGVRIFDVEPEGGVAFAARVGLNPDGVAVGKGDGAGIVVAANAMQGAEGVVEGAILLHEDDDVLGIQKGAAGRGVDFHRLGNGGWKCAGPG